MNIDICIKYWKIWKLYCFFNIPCICIFWYKIEELRALSFPTITNNVLFTFKIPPPESWIHQEDKCGFISEKSWDFEDWFSLWLILWETDTDSLSASTSQFSQATIKRLFFLFPPFCYRKTSSIFSQQKFCSITNTFYGGFRKLYFLCFFSSPDCMFSVCSLCLILLVRIDPITIIAFHVNTEIDQTRRAIVINMIWAYSQSRLCRLDLVNNLYVDGLDNFAFAREYNCLNFKFMAEINLTVMFIGDISILCRRAWGTFPFCQRWNHEIGNGLPTPSSNCTEFILGAGQTNLLTQLAVFDRV